jgi:hypothetical protein
MSLTVEDNLFLHKRTKGERQGSQLVGFTVLKWQARTSGVPNPANRRRPCTSASTSSTYRRFHGPGRAIIPPLRCEHAAVFHAKTQTGNSCPSQFCVKSEHLLRCNLTELQFATLSSFRFVLSSLGRALEGEYVESYHCRNSSGCNREYFYCLCATGWPHRW